MTAAQVEELFSKLGEQSKEIREEEFINFCQLPSVTPHLLRMELLAEQCAFAAGNQALRLQSNVIFYTLDGHNGTRAGTISFKDFCVFSPVLNGHGLSEADVQSLWQSVDTDGSSALNKEKFFQFCSLPAIVPHLSQLEQHAAQLELEDPSALISIAPTLNESNLPLNATAPALDESSLSLKAQDMLVAHNADICSVTKGIFIITACLVTFFRSVNNIVRVIL